MMISPNYPLTVLFFGGGQDSIALLYLYEDNHPFRRRFAWWEQRSRPTNFLVLMADTGNEYPETVQHVNQVREFCRHEKISFFLIESWMGYHGRTWQSLSAQMERNDNIMGVGFVKSCTDNLKIKVCYNFLADFLREYYGFDGPGKKVYYQYFQKFGKLNTLIGFAKGEESRVATTCQAELFPELIRDARPKWLRDTVQHRYPLIDLRLDRAGCQQVIQDYKMPVPMPSNCMMCPYQNEAELVYLHRFHPKMWGYWVEREQAKLSKNVQKPGNLGAKGEKPLPVVLEQALRKYGHWTDQQLREYRMSHGHCVKSKY